MTFSKPLFLTCRARLNLRACLAEGRVSIIESTPEPKLEPLLYEPLESHLPESISLCIIWHLDSGPRPVALEPLRFSHQESGPNKNNYQDGMTRGKFSDPFFPPEGTSSIEFCISQPFPGPNGLQPLFMRSYEKIYSR